VLRSQHRSGFTASPPDAACDSGFRPGRSWLICPLEAAGGPVIAETPARGAIRFGRLVDARKVGALNRDGGDMTNRRVSAAAAMLVATVVLAACSEQPQVASEPSADVSIDHSTTRVHSVNCSQYQWFWTIDLGDEIHGAEAVVLLHGDRATAKWVKFHDFAGFTGSAWEGGAGSATATFANSTYTFTGNVFGYGPDNPNKPDTEGFKIVAHC
jgi:Mycobacterium 19 kDa lipoprotein antigen